MAFKKLTAPGLFIFFLFVYSCSKLDTTTLGGDLIPAVDNVSTFADTLDVTATTMFLPDTSVKISLTSEHAIGKIDNDPVFGRTVAETYIQLKPVAYPFSFLNTTDTLVGIDSMVLSLAYIGEWGDISSPPSFDVYEVSSPGFDSPFVLRNVAYRPDVKATPLVSNVPFNISGNGSFQKIMFGKDSVKNQIRLKIADKAINTAFLTQFVNRDTLPSSNNNALRSDSLFRTFYRGFGIRPSAKSANALIYVSLGDPGTRLEVFYRKKNTLGTDTLYKAFPVNTTDLVSAHANYIKRDYAGSELQNPNPQFSYVQTAPGAYVDVDLKSVSNLSNRVVHRAYLQLEQVPMDPVMDTTFSIPRYLYYDLKDSIGVNRWKPIYYDLNPLASYDPDNALNFFPISSGPDLNYMGSIPAIKKDYLGRNHYYYNLNVTRYIQRIISKRAYNYNLRVVAASDFNYPQYAEGLITFQNPVAYGRVKFGSGANANYKMKLVMIYSEVK